MAITLDVKLWEANLFKRKYSYIRVDGIQNKYFRVIKGGVTGSVIPNFDVSIGTQIIDNTVIWLAVDEIKIDFDINNFIPEKRQDEDLFQKFRELKNFGNYHNEIEYSDIYNKYKDPWKLSDKALTEVIIEKGYKYIADANIIQGEQLKTVFGYLKALHALKGSRQGLRLALRLLGFPFTETLWYEQDPIGEPHTAKIELDIPYSAFTDKTLTNFSRFLRNYVYPLITLVIDIDPFTLNQSHIYMTGIGKITYDFTISHTFPLSLDGRLLDYQYTEGFGTFLYDSTTFENNGYILENFDIPNLLLAYDYSENSGTLLNDKSSNSNDGNIITSVINNILLNYLYSEGSGASITDFGIEGNNASIITSIIDNFMLNYEYAEGSGTLLNDLSSKNNDGNIITSIIDNVLLNYEYTEGSGTSITDSSTNTNNGNIISNTNNIPRYGDLLSWYQFNNNANDELNNYNGTLTGGSYQNNNSVNFAQNNIDRLNLPNTLLHNRSIFSVVYWLDINSLNTEMNTFLSCATSLNNNELIFGFDAVINKFVIYLNSIQYDLGSIDIINQINLLNLHMVVLTRNLNYFNIFIDDNFFISGNLSSYVQKIDANGLVIAQEQDSVNGGYSTAQSGNFLLHDLKFYNIALSHNEVKRLYNEGF